MINGKVSSSDDDMEADTTAHVSKLWIRCQRARVTNPSQRKLTLMLIPGSSALLRVDWLVAGQRSLVDSAGRIGLSACPGRPDLGGTVEADIRKLASLGISVVVTLVDQAELEFYGVFGLRNALREAGLLSLQFPIHDAEPPTDLLATRALCTEILRWAGEGKHLLIHCIGGWGRSGTIAAALLIHEGYPPQQAIGLVRKSRSPRCIESASQERFVVQYAHANQESRRFYVILTKPELPERLGGEPGNRRLRRSGRPAMELLSAETLRERIADHTDLHDPSSVLILSGVAHPEQLDSDLDLLLDRAFSCENSRWQATPLGSLLEPPPR